MAALTRREFLRSSAATTALLALDRLTFGTAACGATPAAGAMPVPPYRGWEDVYRSRWSWDKVVRSSHFVNCWYQSHCAWDVYVKDGINPIELAGGEGHLRPIQICLQPSQNDRDTRVEVVRVVAQRHEGEA